MCVSKSSQLRRGYKWWGCKRVLVVEIQARGGEIFLKEVERYFCKRWKNISGIDVEIFLQEMGKYR